MISLSDCVSLDYGSATYTVVLNDEEFNLIVLLLSSFAPEQIFADYSIDPDAADALYADALTGMVEAI